MSKRKSLFKGKDRQTDIPVKRSYFFEQFYKDFISPYGIALKVKSTKDIKRILKPFNCEFLKRPGIAMSEFGDTFFSNFTLLDDELIDYVSSRDFTNLMKVMRKLAPSADNVNTKNKSNINRKGIPESLRTLFSCFLGLNDEVNNIMSPKTFRKSFLHMMHLGASMYILSLWMFIFYFCLKHVKWVKQAAALKPHKKFSKSFSKWIKSRSSSREELIDEYLEVSLIELAGEKSTKNKYYDETSSSSSTNGDSSPESSPSGRAISNKRSKKSKKQSSSSGSSDASSEQVMKKPRVHHSSKSSSSRGSKPPHVTGTAKKTSLFSQSRPAKNVSVKRRHLATLDVEDNESSADNSDDMAAPQNLASLPSPPRSYSSSDSQQQPIQCVTPPMELEMGEPVTSTVTKVDFSVQKKKKSASKGKEVKDSLFASSKIVKKEAKAATILKSTVERKISTSTKKLKKQVAALPEAVQSPSVPTKVEVRKSKTVPTKSVKKEPVKKDSPTTALRSLLPSTSSKTVQNSSSSESSTTSD